MASFYLDENVSSVLAVLLRLLGNDVLTTEQLGNKGATDVAQLLTALRTDRVLVSHNRVHMEMLAEAWQAFAPAWNVSPTPCYPGLLVIPDGNRLPTTDAARVIHDLASAESLTGRFLNLKRALGWRDFG